MASTTAMSAESLVNSLGINTHIDFGAYGYQNLATVEAAIEYLGVNNIRDSPGTLADLSSWQQVAQATGAKFDAYIGETSPAGMVTELATIRLLAGEGILNAIEGGNEEDDPYPQSLGNTLGITALFQRQIWAAGQQFNLPVINMSFGAGWTSVNHWHGDYDKVGNLSAYTTYGNAHTYPSGAPDATIQMLNSDAKLAAASRPVMTTEIGWNTVNSTTLAKYVLDAAMDGIKDGDVRTYFYALFNDMSGSYGLMNSDGTPTAAGTALHDLTTLLKDSHAGSFTPGSLNYTLSGTQSGDNSLLMEKSDGTYWLSLWNESAGAHTITLQLNGTTASQIKIFDPLTGTAAEQSLSNTGTAQITVPDHPVLVEIVPNGGGGGGGGGGSGPNDLAVTVPGSETVAAGATMKISGVSVTDAWAASNTGSMALNVYDKTGSITFAGHTYGPGGGKVSGGMFNGSLAQINSALAGLTYQAASGSGSDTLTVDVWNQGGVEVTKTIGITVTGDSGGGGGGGGGGGVGGSYDVTVPPGQYDYNAMVSNETIGATSGNHMIFLGGTGDTLTATGGNETVQAYYGSSSITTGAGNDLISYAGSNNVINAGGGSNILQDSGSRNTIVLAAVGQGIDDIYGYVMHNGDRLDLRIALAGTNWNGDMAMIGNYISTSTNGSNSAVISVSPTGMGGASRAVATLESSGPVSLSTLLGHSITH